MGLFGISGKNWRNIGKWALRAAPIVAAPFTGGASLLTLGIGAGAGAAGGALEGGGWKGALLGGGLGAIPGGGAGAAAGSVVKEGAKAGLKQGLVQAGKQLGTQAAIGAGTKLGGKYLGGTTGQVLGGVANAALGGGGWRDIGTGAVQGAKQGAIDTATGVGTNLASRALTGGQPGQPQGNVYSNLLPGESGGMPTGQGGQPSGFQLAQWGGNGSQALAPTGGGGGSAQGGGGQAQAGGAPTPRAPESWPQTPGQSQQGGGGWDKWGPVATQGGGLLAGGLAARWAEQQAMKRSPDELQSRGGVIGSAEAQQKAGGNLFNVAGGLLNQGKNYIGGPASYYQTLLSGNRAAQAQAVAAPTAAITDVYRGAERNLERSGIRGAARDVQQGELGRQRASQIAGLTTGVQPAAADALARLGTDVMQIAPGLYGTGGQLMGNAGNLYGDLLGQDYANRRNAQQVGAETGKEIGGFVRDTLPIIFGQGQGKTPTPAQPPSRQAPVPTRPPTTPLPPSNIPKATPGAPTAPTPTSPIGGVRFPPKKVPAPLFPSTPGRAPAGGAANGPGWQADWWRKSGVQF